MSVVIAACAVALALAIAVWLTPWFKPSLQGALNIAAWVGMVALMGALYAGVLPAPAAALAAAGLGASAMCAPTTRLRFLALASAPAGAAVGVALTLASLVLASLPAAGEPSAEGLLLYAGQWAAFSAALAALMMSSGFMSWRLSQARTIAAPWSAGLAVVGLALGVFVLGALRSDVPSTDFAIYLSSSEGPVMWGLAQGQGGANALGLRVVLEVPSVNPLLILGALLALIASVMGGRLSWKQQAGLWGLSGAAHLIALVEILRVGYSPSLPELSRYAGYAKIVGAELQIPERVVDAGGFIHGGQVFVLWSTILPEIAALCLSALLTLGVALMLMKAQGQPLERAAQAGVATPKPDAPHRLEPHGLEGLGALWARDMMVRGAALLWLAWFLGLLVSWKMQATYGLASPNEWSALGLAILGSGLTCLMFSSNKRLMALLPGLLFSLCVLYVLTSLAFGAPIGVSMRF